ncbi:MAG: hypothetical protein ACI4OH_05245 [Mitsuokella sp.]|uniref:hypothetical protein n=1 Tax=Mitsuokella sp. TaxID=2049034 RepID=UPI003EFC0CF2
MMEPPYTVFISKKQVLHIVHTYELDTKPKDKAIKTHLIRVLDMLPTFSMTSALLIRLQKDPDVFLDKRIVLNEQDLISYIERDSVLRILTSQEARKKAKSMVAEIESLPILSFSPKAMQERF